MEFITTFKHKWSAKLLCEILSVSESGYYKHLRSLSQPGKHEKLLAQIYELLREDEENSNYGVRRIFSYLKLYKGYIGSYSTVWRVCKDNNLIIKRKRITRGITKADSAAQKAENLIKQDFTAQVPIKNG